MNLRLRPDRYRPDIDGLRAVAVLSVVLYHAFPLEFKSGFMGVDIFFVISGYLISSIIFPQLLADKFSFHEFYKKRVLRILPSLLVVLYVSLFFGYLALVSTELKGLGKHLTGAATFTSNFFLWNESGYFDTDSIKKPLLHLWSLAIEEQFYIFYPLIVWLGWRLRLSFFGLITLLFGISFGFNLYYFNDRAGDFYHPLARFWEIMLGASIASLSLNTRNKLTSRENLLSICGLLLLAIGAFKISDKIIFPGFWALSPTIGAALIILAGPNSFLNRHVFSSRGFVWVGKISYPMYLWHWPIFSFANIILGPTQWLINILFISIAILLAWISTTLIEAPFRFGKRNPKKEAGLIVGLLGLGVLGLIVYLKDGFPHRDSRIQKVIYQGGMTHDLFYQYHMDHFPFCTPLELRNEAQKFNGIIRCFQSYANRPVDFAILGDSHAEQLFIGLAEALKNKNIVYYHKDMAPLIGEPQFEHIFAELLRNPTIKKVVINAFWLSKNVPYEKLSETIGRLIAAKKEVYLFDDVPDYEFASASDCTTTRLFRRTTYCSMPTNYFENKLTNTHDAFAKIKKIFPTLNLVFSSRYFCDAVQCSMIRNNEIIYRDWNHLTLNGSRFLATQILRDYPSLAN